MFTRTENEGKFKRLRTVVDLVLHSTCGEEACQPFGSESLSCRNQTKSMSNAPTPGTDMNDIIAHACNTYPRDRRRSLPAADSYIWQVENCVKSYETINN